ncbi:MAG: hypothetical protein M1536_04250 [Firmicutes bacterium]|nr:hypothetical protein [Bacillota bacterium]
MAEEKFGESPLNNGNNLSKQEILEQIRKRREEILSGNYSYEKNGKNIINLFLQFNEEVKEFEKENKLGDKLLKETEKNKRPPGKENQE